MAHRIMPRDVATRWNSTYDMLAFALEYRQAIDDITGDRSLGLRNFELNEKEWEIAEQLCNVLKVRRNILTQMRTRLNVTDC